jgi:hypothetical protein
MDLDNFKRIANDNCRTQIEIENMMRNALNKKKPEFADIALEALNKKYPGWDDQSTRRGGSKPTTANFMDDKRSFPSGKSAYIWMVEKFINKFPELFSEINWETIFVSKGVKRLYFARSPEKVFFSSPHLAKDTNNFTRLKNGWYANLNLSNDQKFEILCRIAAVKKFKFDIDWGWLVLP